MGFKETEERGFGTWGGGGRVGVRMCEMFQSYAQQRGVSFSGRTERESDLSMEGTIRTAPRFGGSF